MATGFLSATKERLLLELKTKGPRAATRLAKRLGITAVAVRQHLQVLLDAGLVSFAEERGKVGRPRRVWSLTDHPETRARFPDSHAELTIDLLDAARDAFGEDGLERLIQSRAARQADVYRERLEALDALDERVAELARIRREEGYMATWSRQSDGSFLLVERHCPVCSAAEVCKGLCRAELWLFRAVLGDGAAVERIQYLLDGDLRCTYRITPARA